MFQDLTKEEKNIFYNWLSNFIKFSGYDNYYNPTDGGDYKIITIDDQEFYQGTYEYNKWIKLKLNQYINGKKNSV